MIVNGSHGCPEPLPGEINLSEPDVREAYNGMLNLYHRRFVELETDVVFADEAAEIARTLKVSEETLAIIAQRALGDFLDYTGAASFPYSWTSEGAALLQESDQADNN